MSSPIIAPFQGLRQNVAQLLREAICDGAFRPGDSLKDVALARQFQVSRSPIREALLQLEKEGLVRNCHNQGWFVIDLTPEEMAEITSVRAVLEVLALKAAAENIAESDLREIRVMEANFCRAFDAADLPEASASDSAFHRAIWHLSGHRLLEATLLHVTRPYFAYLQAVIRSQGISVEKYLNTVQRHQALVQYLSGDREHTAEELITEHMNITGLRDWDVLMKLLAK